MRSVPIAFRAVGVAAGVLILAPTTGIAYADEGAGITVAQYRLETARTLAEQRDDEKKDEDEDEDEKDDRGDRDQAGRDDGDDEADDDGTDDDEGDDEDAVPGATQTPYAPVSAGGGGTSAALAVKGADEQGPGTTHTVIGLVLAGVAAVAVALRSSRRRRVGPDAD
ncbi:hypothetical protein [Streptomyces sp. NPDC000410]|uniref:hypothetical protein n=1 Tax=Streptomyces sp. NPDC000410 TaxID=3154254 RepID=UPI00331A1BD2